MSPDTSWTLAPTVLVPTAVVGGLYVMRWRRACAETHEHRPSAWRLASFLGGLVVVLVALVSPVDALAGELFFVHMIQHILLLDIVPILLVLGLTKVLMRPVTRRLARVERAAGPLAHPVFAVVAYCGVIWVWHVPAFYDLALRHEAIHELEHAAFITVGLLYWWYLLSPIRSRLRLDGMGPVGYMVSTKLVVGLLGVAIAFAPSAIYSFYRDLPGFWGLTHGEDQSISGLTMALEQSLVMGVALAALFIRALAESERDEQRAERYEAA